jgi:hypothetical protein
LDPQRRFLKVAVKVWFFANPMLVSTIAKRIKGVIGRKAS